MFSTRYPVTQRKVLTGSTMVLAASAGQSDVVHELVEGGAKVDATNEKGQTSL